MKTVAIIGASARAERYAHRAQVLLMEQGYTVFPVSRRGEPILGVAGYDGIEAIGQPIDTVTVYVNPAVLESMVEAIVAVRPRRVILNPGTESVQATARLRQAGIEVVEACTLVLLQTGQF